MLVYSKNMQMRNDQKKIFYLPSHRKLYHTFCYRTKHLEKPRYTFSIHSYMGAWLFIIQNPEKYICKFISSCDHIFLQIKKWEFIWKFYCSFFRLILPLLKCLLWWEQNIEPYSDKSTLTDQIFTPLNPFERRME